MMKVLSALHDGYRAGHAVSLDVLKHKADACWPDGFYKVFNKRHGDKKSTHPVRRIVTGERYYSLIDPQQVKVPD
jgi:hypothetical protein